MDKGTKRRYAFSLKVWLDFLHAIGESGEYVAPDVLGAFKEWRLSAQDNPEHVTPGSFRVDLAAIRRFYLWAADHEGRFVTGASCRRLAEELTDNRVGFRVRSAILQ